MAGYLRETFPNDGEEVVDVLARHYLDALAAVPDDADADALREQAVAALVRAADRAARTGAPDHASRSYLQAADLLEQDGGDPRRCAQLVENAIEAAIECGAASEVVDLAEANIQRYAALGETRAAARSRIQQGRGLIRMGRYTGARETLNEAIAGLQDPPDVDTVAALEQVALVETWAGTPEADAATVDVLRLAQGLEIGPTAMAGVLHVRGMHLARDGRLMEAAFHMREAVRLAEEADRPDLVGLYLTNLGSSLMGYDPSSSADETRRALDISRRGGNRRGVSVCVSNLAQVLIHTGRWDEAAELLATGGDADETSEAGELAAWARLLLVDLRGDAGDGTRHPGAVRDPAQQ